MRGRVRGKRPEARVVGGVIALQSLCIQENKGESAPNTEIGERLNTSAYFFSLCEIHSHDHIHIWVLWRLRCACSGVQG